MIHYTTGNILESSAEALVNTVNTVGVMGKGIALQFKERFPNNNKIYVKACKSNELVVGKLLICEEGDMFAGKKLIINFPTKTNWKLPSEYSYIESGLQTLKAEIIKRGVKSIAIPPLGAGNGGLDWNRVRTMIEQYLSNLDCDIIIYEPSVTIQQRMKAERVKLTPARAMMLEMLYDLVSQGEFISEFAAEKVTYFLQRFGAEDYFKLKFIPYHYGPYSGKVKHVLYHLNGSYIKGYSSKESKPFEELWPVEDGRSAVVLFLQNSESAHYLEIVNNTKQFLSGYYSSFGLELLSSVDYLMNTEHTNDVDLIMAKLAQWNTRKKNLFANRKFVEKAINHILEFSARMQ
ncbi:MAG: macro domain-containing protein [Bacteroidales bacterium]